MKPLISVIMPVYQVEKYISNAISSVANQNFKSYEVILVNDGTKDNSIDIAQHVLKETNVNFTLLNQENKGLSSARNAGIRSSCSEWIVCIDSDDVIAPNLLERFYEVINKYSTDIVICNSQLVYNNDLFKEPSLRDIDFIIKRKTILNHFLMRRLRIIAPGVIVRRDFLIKHDLWYDESMRYSEDQHFIWRLLHASDGIVYIKDQLYNYLQRDNSIMSSSDTEKVLTGFYGMTKLEDKLDGTLLLKKFFLSRWVLAALNASTRMMNMDNFTRLAEKIEYKRYIRKLLLFPDLKIAVLSFVLLLNPRIFYKIGRKL